MRCHPTRPGDGSLKAAISSGSVPRRSHSARPALCRPPMGPKARLTGSSATPSSAPTCPAGATTQRRDHARRGRQNRRHGPAHPGRGVDAREELLDAVQRPGRPDGKIAVFAPRAWMSDENGKWEEAGHKTFRLPPRTATSATGYLFDLASGNATNRDRRRARKPRPIEYPASSGRPATRRSSASRR